MRQRLRLPSIGLNNLAFALALAILVALAWQGGKTQVALLGHGESARASLELISEVQGIFSSLQDIETGARGFVITGDDSYLAPYQRARRELGDQRARLGAQLAMRGDDHAAWLAELDDTIADRLAIAEGNIAARRDLGLEGASEHVRAAGGKQVMDHLRAQLGQLEAAERTRLARQRDALQRQFEAGRKQLLLGSVVVALLLVGGLLAMNGNLHARRRLMLEAQARRAFLRSVVDADDNAIFVCDASGRFELCNRAFAALLGLSPDEVEDRLPAEVPGIEGVATLLQDDPALLEGGDAVHAERRVVDAQGREWWMQLAKQRLVLPDGTHAVLAVAVDISARREIAQLKSEFVSTVSHELRTPLTAIRGALGMVVGGMAGDIPDDMRPLLDIAHKNSERLVLLINDILDIEKLDAGRVQLQLAPVALHDALRQAVDQNSTYAAQFDVALALDAEADVRVMADADRFAQVMANLISNAVKYSPRGGTVQVEGRRRDGHAEITVVDQGSGIPAAFQSRIFERFAQADSTDARKVGGTGLGLSITKALVEQHGGTIAFTSVPGRTRFVVTLPLAQSPAPGREPTSRAAPPRLLVVDDDAGSAEQLTQILRGAGYEPVVAPEGAAARAALAAARFRGVIVSLGLGDEDALGLVRALRENIAYRHLPVLAVGLLPGQAPDGDVLGGAIGIADWLQKPFDSDRVVAAVRHGIDGVQRTPQVLHVEDDEDLRTLVAKLLRDEPLELHGAATLAAARAALMSRRHDLVILDLMLPDGDGAALLEELATLSPPPRVVVFSARDTELPPTSLVLRRLVKARQGAPELAAVIRAQLDQWPGGAGPEGGDA